MLSSQPAYNHGCYQAVRRSSLHRVRITMAIRTLLAGIRPRRGSLPTCTRWPHTSRVRGARGRPIGGTRVRRESAGVREADGTADAGAAETAVAVGVLGEVLLVIV